MNGQLLALLDHHSGKPDIYEKNPATASGKWLLMMIITIIIILLSL